MRREPRHRDGELLVGRYRVERTLFGGLGEVVVAADLREEGRLVALKTFPRAAKSTPGEGRAGLGKEAEAWLALGAAEGSFFAELKDVLLIADTPYLLMPFYDRGSAADLVGREGLSAEAKFDLLTGVLLGMWQISKAGLVHRDLKPGNVLIAADGRALISDFGLTRELPRSGSSSSGNSVLTGPAGTLAFMAPEFFRGDSAGGIQTDIWAFGVMCHLLLTGKLPFNATDGDTLISRIVSEPLRRDPAIRAYRLERLEEVVSVLLAKETDRRPRTWTEVARIWEQVVRIGSDEAGRSENPRDGRVVVDRSLIVDTWEGAVFPDRMAARLVREGKVQTGWRVTTLLALRDSEALYALGKPREAIARLLPRVGDPRSPASPIAQFLRDGHAKAQEAPDETRTTPDMVSPDAWQGIVWSLLRCYVALLEDEVASDSEKVEAEVIARRVAASSIADRDVKRTAGQVFALQGEFQSAQDLLRPLVEETPCDAHATNTLFLCAILQKDTNTAAELALHLSERGDRSASGMLYTCAHMWGVLQRWQLAASFARLAIERNQQDLYSREALILSLWNLNQKDEARARLAELVALAPEWPRTARLVSAIGARPQE